MLDQSYDYPPWPGHIISLRIRWGLYVCTYTILILIFIAYHLLSGHYLLILASEYAICISFLRHQVQSIVHLSI